MLKQQKEAQELDLQNLPRSTDGRPPSTNPIFNITKCVSFLFIYFLYFLLINNTYFCCPVHLLVAYFSGSSKI